MVCMICIHTRYFCCACSLDLDAKLLYQFLTKRRNTPPLFLQTIGISPTTLKKLCRHYGIPRWPFRKIAGADRAADRLDAILAEPPVQRQSTAKSASRVEGHHRGNAVGEATVSVRHRLQVNTREQSCICTDTLSCPEFGYFGT